MKKIDWDAVAIVVLVLVIVSVVFGTFALINSVRETDQRCIRNGYAGRANLAGLDYCYRLSGDVGELILSEKLK